MPSEFIKLPVRLPVNPSVASIYGASTLAFSNLQCPPKSSLQTKEREDSVPLSILIPALPAVTPAPDSPLLRRISLSVISKLSALTLVVVPVIVRFLAIKLFVIFTS